MKIVQFELWQECNNNCEFCYLTQERLLKKTPVENKLKAIKDVDDFLSSSKINNYDCVGLIGGEFFQGQLETIELKVKFKKLCYHLNQLLKDNIINNVWISATLTIGKQEDLFEILNDCFDDLSRVWITTSWDYRGRFKTPKMKTNWESNVLRLLKEYPKVNINVTTILTQSLIEFYNNNENVSFNSYIRNIDWYFKIPNTFIGENGTIEQMKIGKILCNQAIPDFFPKRVDFLKFLLNFKFREPKELYDKLIGIDYRADELIKNFDDGKKEVYNRDKEVRMGEDDSELLDCGHSCCYQCYCDSDKCSLCDKNMIFQL